MTAVTRSCWSDEAGFSFHGMLTRVVGSAGKRRKIAGVARPCSSGCAQEEAAVQAVTAASERWAKWRKTAVGELSLGCTGGVAMKSGMVPAREIQPFNHCRGPKVLADAGSRQRIQVRRGTRWRVARRPRSARRRGERGGEAIEEVRRSRRRGKRAKRRGEASEAR